MLLLFSQQRYKDQTTKYNKYLPSLGLFKFFSTVYNDVGIHVDCLLTEEETDQMFQSLAGHKYTRIVSFNQVLNDLQDEDMGKKFLPLSKLNAGLYLSKLEIETLPEHLLHHEVVAYGQYEKFLYVYIYTYRKNPWVKEVKESPYPNLDTLVNLSQLTPENKSSINNHRLVYFATLTFILSDVW